MYHYVRDLKNTKYPDIKGLNTNLFIEQIEYFKKNYNYISTHDLIDNNSLPDNPILLTFDDGYLDHYITVYPILKEMNISGCFFPIVNASKNRKVLDVNKIHFILASVKNKEIIVNEIDNYILKSSNNYNLKKLKEYKNNIPKSRFDTEDVMYIKCMLQRKLPIDLRNELSEILFEKYVSESEEEFASTLYTTTEQLQEMYNNGMSIGAHGYLHNWLANISDSKQEFEINESVKFLNDIGVKSNERIMSYPYGSYNDNTLMLMDKYDFKLGFTTKVDKAYLDKPLELSRFDTNDFPKDRNA